MNGCQPGQCGYLHPWLITTSAYKITDRLMSFQHSIANDVLQCCFLTEGGWGDTAFGVDPVHILVNIHIAFCLHSDNGWILTKLAQTHYWDGGKK